MPLISASVPRAARAALAVLALCGVGSAPLSGQSAEQRRAIDAFRDSVAAVTDSMLLRVLETRLLTEVSRTRTDAFLHLRLGHLALRQGDLGGPSHYDDAASEFKWSAELAPQWPYAWYGLGLAEYALGERAGKSPELRPLLARDAWSRSAQAFSKAVSLEPGFAPRLEELARRALRARTPEKAGVVLDALRRVAHDPNGAKVPRLILARARVERELGDSAALSSFLAFLTTGETRGLALLELGRTRMALGDRAGAVEYIEGVASDDPGAIAEARSDLAPIGTEAELADFDLRRGAARADMLRRFWFMRDRLELRSEGERLAEHIRRQSVARREFVLVGDDGVERLDDRGRIYVRHGRPDDRASFAIPGVEPNESWRYRRGGVDMVLHFVARQSPNDFRLIESVLDVSDVRTALASPALPTSGRVAGASSEQLLRSRSALAPLYRRIPSGGSAQVADYLARERALGRRGIQLGTGSDTYPLRFGVNLDAWGSVVVAGGSGAQPMLQLLFAIPGYAVEPATGAVGVVYPVRVRFVALDSSGNIAASVDTVTRIEPGSRIASNRSLVGSVAIPVRPGRLLVQAAVQYGNEGGTAFGVESVMIPSPGAQVLALGDLLLGTRRGRLPVPLGDGTELNLAPGGIIHRSDGLDLAVEVFGLAAGQETTLRLYLAPQTGTDDGSGRFPKWQPFPNRRAHVRISRASGSSTIVRWRVGLPLKRLKPGSWTMAVVATDPTGKLARREARLELVVP